jgi:aspartate racemase
MHIGLIGGIGPAATEFYYRGLSDRHAKSGTRLDLTIANAEVRDLSQNLANKDTRTQAGIFAGLITRLKAAGAQAAAVTSMGGHFCIGELIPISPLPILNGIPEVDAAVTRGRFKTIGIIGTRMVMETRLYGAISSATVVVPLGAELAEVHESYVAMATAGRVSDAQRRVFLAAGVLAADREGTKLLWLGPESGNLDPDQDTRPLEVLDPKSGIPIHASRIVVRTGSGRLPPLQEGHDVEQLLEAHAMAAVTTSTGAVRVLRFEDGKAILTIEPRASRVEAIAAHPTLPRIAIGWGSGEIEIWALDEPRRLADFSNGQPLSSLAFGPGGKMLAVQPPDRVTLWDTDTGREIDLADGRMEGVRHATFLAGDKRISIQGAAELRLLDAVNGRQVKSWKPPYGLSSEPGTVEIGDGGGYFMYDGKRDEFGLLDAMTGERVAPLRPSLYAPKPAWSEQAKTLAYATSRQSIVMLKPGNPAGELEIKGFPADISALTFGGVLPRLAAVSDGRFGLWDALTGEKVADMQGRWREPGVAFSPDGEHLALYGAADAVVLVDPRTGQERARLPGHGAGVRSVQFIGNGKTLVARTENLDWLVWNVASYSLAFRIDSASQGVRRESNRLIAWGDGYRLVQLPDIAALAADGKLTKLTNAASEGGQGNRTAGTEAITRAALARDGKTAILVRGRNTIEYFDVAAGRSLGFFSEHDGAITALVWVGADRLASISDSGPAVLWNTTERKPIARLGEAQASTFNVVASPDGARLLTLPRDANSQPMLWQSSDGQPLAALGSDDRKATVELAAFSPDGRAVTTSSRGRVDVWDALSGRWLRKLAQHRRDISVLAVQPVTGQVLSAARDQDMQRERTAESAGRQYANVQFRRPDAGDPVTDIAVEGAVTQAVFSGDGSLLVVGTSNGAVRVVDPANGYALIERQGTGAAVAGLALSPNAAMLLATFEDGVTRAWRTAPGAFEKRPTPVELVEAARKK